MSKEVGLVGTDRPYFGARLSSGSVATKAESKARTITVSIMAWFGESMRATRARLVPSFCKYAVEYEKVAGVRRNSSLGMNRFFIVRKRDRLFLQGVEWCGQPGRAEVDQALDAPIKIIAPAKTARSPLEVLLVGGGVEHPANRKLHPPK